MTSIYRPAINIHFYRVLLATMRDKGLCPCPRCLVPKSQLDQLGLRCDIAIRLNRAQKFMAEQVETARRAIYHLGHPIKGKAVEDLLKDFSGVPTQVSVSRVISKP